ncbi:DUF6082 family protein [Actinoplanes aureus]|uniref:Uncharacterized protein n=1 Tax=Actinoplanes aureus TaxID=2792083 RepID=A0A931CBH5_9ACTN|nr:DUF6082 family protein [Actinoplanes aureus]MBG0564917.1 hypothetical protein [Actinoplanes aureus]
MAKRDAFRPNAVTGKKIAWWAATAAALGIACVIGPLFYLLSPAMTDQDITRVSDLGQAYGILSAALSAITLGVVATSLVYQARQERSYRIDAIRQRQKDLLSLAIEEPEVFGPCIDGDFAKSESSEEVRRYLFTTLILSYGLAGYEMGYFSKEHLREEFARPMFRGPVGRQLWEKRRKVLSAQATTDAESYNAIFEAEYQRALEELAGETTPKEASTDPPK